MNKFSEFKSTTEGSCVEDNQKHKYNSIMDNFLSDSKINGSNGSILSNNYVGVPIGKNANRSVNGVPFTSKFSKGKKMKHNISPLSLSLIGSMMMESQR